MATVVAVAVGLGGASDARPGADAATGDPAPAFSGEQAAGAPEDPDAAATEAPALTEGPAEATPLLARLGPLDVFLPAAAPVVVGYHEAATVTALGVEPIGALTEDRNTTRTDLPPDVAGGTPYLVLSSRGRSAGPTSAVDVVLPVDETVLAPVTGTVLDVRDYLLYGAHADQRIEIVPDARPDVRIVMIHVDGASVAAGDRVLGGITPVARTARLLPFSSHIDRETEPERLPHVHLEVQPIEAPRLGDADEEPPGADREGGGPAGD